MAEQQDEAQPKETDPQTKYTHPGVAAVHVLGKLGAILAYVLCDELNADGFVVNFVVCVVLLAADFWVCRNVSGRLLVGLRYWNELDENGESHWRFESRDADALGTVTTADSRVFWWPLYIAPLVWLLFGAVALLKLDFEYLLIVAVALALGMTNVIGYTKCSKTAKQQINSLANTMNLASSINNIL